MELIEDVTEEVINYLTCEDIINLKKSDKLNLLSDLKLREILGKKYLTKMMKQYSDEEYKTQDVDSDKKLNYMISKFCFTSALIEFGHDIDLSTEQIFKMISILTFEQLEKLNDHLNKDKNWY